MSFVVSLRTYSRFVIFLIATKQPVKQTRRRTTQNSYCASGNPIFSRSFLPLHYRELRVCHRLPEAEAARETAPPPVSSYVPSCTPPSRPVYTTSAAPRKLYRVCGRTSRFPRTTLVRNPFQPFGSLFSDSKPADLQLSSLSPET